MLKRKFGIIFGMMFLFSLVSYILIAVFGRRAAVYGEEEKKIVTSFYPVYLITQNLMQGIEGVQVVNLTENQTGCLHDYQLTTKDMRILETADLLVINGGGMELFITQAAQKLAGLTMIDSCEGMELLVGEAHDHDHSHEHDHDHSQEDAAHQDGGTDAFGTQSPVSGEYADEEGVTSGNSSEAQNQELEENGHVWMDMERYLLQIQTISDGLCMAFEQEEARIRANELAYREKAAALSEEYAGLKEALSGISVVTFHDAFIYLCDSYGMEVVHGIDLDADSALSAGEIAEITDEIRLHGVYYLLAERETGAVAEQIAQETGCTVIYLNPLTSGSSDLDAYLTAMRENLELLEEIQR